MRKVQFQDVKLLLDAPTLLLVGLAYKWNHVKSALQKCNSESVNVCLNAL
jgi:hypothetical protein